MLNICEACYLCNCEHCIIICVLVGLCKIMGVVILDQFSNGGQFLMECNPVGNQQTTIQEM
jgi:hypothetical protein